MTKHQQSAQPAIQTTVRCFRTAEQGAKGYGIWAMTTETRGVFYKGNGYERQAPRWSVTDLLKPTHPTAVAISPDEAIELLAYWPEAQADLRKVFARHPLEPNAQPASEPAAAVVEHYKQASRDYGDLFCWCVQNLEKFPPIEGRWTDEVKRRLSQSRPPASEPSRREPVIPDGELSTADMLNNLAVHLGSGAVKFTDDFDAAGWIAALYRRADLLSERHPAAPAGERERPDYKRLYLRAVDCHIRLAMALGGGRDAETVNWEHHDERWIEWGQRQPARIAALEAERDTIYKLATWPLDKVHDAITAAGPVREGAESKASDCRLIDVLNRLHSMAFLKEKANKYLADINRICNVADKHGWNGIENPKAVWDFFDDQLSERHALEAKLAASKERVKTAQDAAVMAINERRALESSHAALQASDAGLSDRLLAIAKIVESREYSSRLNQLEAIRQALHPLPHSETQADLARTRQENTALQAKLDAVAGLAGGMAMLKAAIESGQASEAMSLVWAMETTLAAKLAE